MAMGNLLQWRFSWEHHLEMVDFPHLHYVSLLDGLRDASCCILRVILLPRSTGNVNPGVKKQWLLNWSKEARFAC